MPPSVFSANADSMNLHNNSRVVWNSDQGLVGDKPSKARRKQQKKKQQPITKAGFPKDGVVRVCREKSGRGGKTVTVLYGLPAGGDLRKDLLKELKQLCGCGGAEKNGAIEIQGDQREKILKRLEEKGIEAKAAGG